MSEPTSKPNYAEILLGGYLLEAMHDVGILPRDVATSGGCRLSIQRDAVVVMETALVIPADKLIRALEIARETMANGGRRHDPESTAPDATPDR